MKKRWIVSAIALAVLLVLLVGVFPPRGLSQGRVSRVYWLYQHWEFDGYAGNYNDTTNNCASGWSWSNIDDASRIRCTGSAVSIVQTRFDWEYRGQGVLFINNNWDWVFPRAGSNIAIEARFRYNWYRGYGSDAIAMMTGRYNGERTCFNGSQFYTCPGSSPEPETHWSSHGAGNAAARSADFRGTSSVWTGWQESPPLDVAATPIRQRILSE